jgi:hypothetical protein
VRVLSRLSGVGGAFTGTSFATSPGACSASAMPTIPPIECPTTVAGASSSGRTAAACAGIEKSPPPGVRPNPGRSTSSTRQRSASRGARRSNDRIEHPSPCSRTTTGAPSGPCHS